MLKTRILFFCTLLSLSFANSVFAKDRQSLNLPIQLNRAKVFLGENLCNDVVLIKGNLISCQSSYELIMKSNWKELIPKIESNPKYLEMFQVVYNGKITPETIADAINQYETSLMMPSRFDDYLKGNKTALSPEEIHGYELFKSYGCAACHTGPNLGGSKFKKMGVAKNYLIGHRTIITPKDLGLYEVTKDTNDIFVFKVPPLRNVSIMNSYYHDGSVKSLHEAVYLMGKYQLGIEIPKKNIDEIVAFLDALTAKSMDSNKKR